MLNKFFLTTFLALVILISGCGTPQPVSELDDFAKCLKESGLKMYGSFVCSVCEKQRALFGTSFHHVGEIECHPRGENPQTELCLQKDISKTPTWILEKDNEEIHFEGFQKLEKLSEITGCPLNG